MQSARHLGVDDEMRWKRETELQIELLGRGGGSAVLSVCYTHKDEKSLLAWSCVAYVNVSTGYKMTKQVPILIAER